MPFAEGTTVSVEKTRAEIESLVRKHGATEFAGGYSATEAGLSFVVSGRRVQFSVKRPLRTDKKLIQKARGRVTYGAPKDAALDKAVADEERRLWRCLLLAIKAKLEIVASGISTFEEEFLAHIVTDNGMTVIDRIKLAGEQTGGLRLLPAVSP